MLSEPPQTAPGGLVETFRGVVFPGDCDLMGHLPTFKYFEMFDMAAHHFFFGLGVEADPEGDYGLADVRQEIDYKAEVRSGALLVVRSGVLSVGRSSIRSFHLMTDASGARDHARLETITVYFDLHKRSAAPLPPDVVQRATALLSAGAE